MDTSAHNLSTLFEQLGLPSDHQHIEQFIKQHRPLPRETPLEDAGFWSTAQARFLHDALEEDSDWCEAVDDLNTRLHG